MKDQKRSTLQTIADNLGLSRAAVSKALAGKKDISQNTIDAVQAEAKRINYVANMAAGALVTGKTKIVVGVFANFNGAMSRMCEGINEVLFKEGFRLLVMSSSKYFELQVENVDWARSIQADGIIIDSLLPNKKFKEHFSRLDVPCVRLDNAGNRINNLDIGQVHIDELKSSKIAVEELIRCGHKNIGLLMHDQYNAEKIKGAQSAINSKVNLKMIHIENANYSTIAEALENPLGKFGKNSITAYLCSGDLVAHMLIKIARAKKIICPRDISVVGFDDLEISKYTEPPLSTIRVPYKEYGRQAGELWLKMNNESSQSKKFKKYITIESEFINRESIGAFIKKRS